MASVRHQESYIFLFAGRLHRSPFDPRAKLYLKHKRKPVRVPSAPRGSRQCEPLLFARHHWQQVKELALRSGFANADEEIDFFSRVKPRFTGLLEFYTLLYQYRLFCPDGQSGNSFLQHEMGKIERFEDLHCTFFDFFRHGNKNPQLMEHYFLRRHFNSIDRNYTRP